MLYKSMTPCVADATYMIQSIVDAQKIDVILVLICYRRELWCLGGNVLFDINSLKWMKINLFKLDLL